MDLLQINKFGSLHDGKQIIFCKVDYLEAEFKRIKKLKHEVILITGNGDEGIDSRHISKMPGNINKWYCQNNLQHHVKLIPIPIGLENTFTNKRRGHGIAWQHAEEKLHLLKETVSMPKKPMPTKLLYANFNVETNKSHRVAVMEYCKQAAFINWDEPTLTYRNFITKVMDHEAVVCPAGNGVDTHRLYEILYCGVVPVTIKIGDYPVYAALYDKLPIVILDSAEELKNEDKIRVLIADAKQKINHLDLLDFNYWRQEITTAANTLVKPKENALSKFFNRLTG